MDRVLSGREDRGRPTLCLVSTTSHHAVAGLTAYIQGRARATKDTWTADSVSRFEFDGRTRLDATAGEPSNRLEEDLGPRSIAALLATSAAGTDAPPAPDVDLGQREQATNEDALTARNVSIMPLNGESFGMVCTKAWRAQDDVRSALVLIPVGASS